MARGTVICSAGGSDGTIAIARVPESWPLGFRRRAGWMVKGRALLFLFFLAPAHARAAGSPFTGRIGVQVERFEERFGESILFADPSQPEATAIQDPAEILLSPASLYDQSTLTSALVEARYHSHSAMVPSVTGRLLAGRTRTRGDLELEGAAWRSIELTNRCSFQAGPASGGGWVDNRLRLRYRANTLPAGLRLLLRAEGERSWARGDSILGALDYTSFRPAIDLNRALGWRGDLSLRGGAAFRRVREDRARSYRAGWAEGEWNHFLSGGGTVRILARTERRHFLQSDSLLPSYAESGFEGSLSLDQPWKLRTLVDTEARRLDVLGPSSFLQDHWSAQAKVRLTASWSDLRGGGAAEGSPATSLTRDWILGVGARLGALQSRGGDFSDHSTAGALASFSVEGWDPLWLDLAVEAGRRHYRLPSGDGAVIFHDLEISLSPSSYDYLNASLLIDSRLPGKLQIEAALLWDRERHDDPADNVTLSSFTLSLTRRL